MKSLKSIFICLFMMAICTPVFAQTRGFHGGFRVGVGSSTFRADSLENLNGNLMLSGGFHATYQFTKYFAMEVEALVTQKGAKNSGTRRPDILMERDNYDETYRLVYAEIPIFLKVGVPLSKHMYVKAFAGPSFNFNLYSAYTLNYESHDKWDAKDQEMTGINTMEYSAVGGLGFEMQGREDGGIFSIDFRTSLGLSKVGTLNSYGHDGYNNYVGLFVGYTF